MFKYILKRIGLSVVVLLGVSVIIYFLVRLMPVNYLDNKFSPQLQQGTITQEEIDDFKKNYGLYIPEAYLDFDVEGYSKGFRRGIQKIKYQELQDGSIDYYDFYSGKYDTAKNVTLTLNKDNYSFVIADESGEIKSYVKSGSFTADKDGFVLNVKNEYMSELRTPSWWNKLVAKIKGEGKPYMYIDLYISGYKKAFVKTITEEEYEALNEKYENADDMSEAYSAFYAGEYAGKGGAVLKLNSDNTYRVLEDSTEVKSGTYFTDARGVGTAAEGSMKSSAYSYKTLSVWNKFTTILSGYFTWLGNMLSGDLGDSFVYQRPVGSVIADHMWISFFISLVALIFQFAISIPLGITSATRQYSVVDYTVTVVTMIGISLPSFFFAALLIKVFSSWLGWFPASGLVSGGGSEVGFAYMLDMLHHLVLPMMVLIVLSIGGLMRYTRTNMLEVLNSDYIRTARSKGLSEKRVIYVHAFRNTMIPLMTLLAGILPSLFGGAMITEEVFAIEGIGRLAYKALQQGDIPFIMGYNMFLAVLTVIGTLLSDLMYAVVDPRVKLVK